MRGVPRRRIRRVVNELLRDCTAGGEAGGSSGYSSEVPLLLLSLDSRSRKTRSRSSARRRSAGDCESGSDSLSKSSAAGGVSRLRMFLSLVMSAHRPSSTASSTFFVHTRAEEHYLLTLERTRATLTTFLTPPAGTLEEIHCKAAASGRKLFDGRKNFIGEGGLRALKSALGGGS